MSVKAQQLYYVQEDFVSSWGGRFFVGGIVKVCELQGSYNWKINLLRGCIIGDNQIRYQTPLEEPDKFFGLLSGELLDHCIHVLDEDYVHPTELIELPEWMR